MMIQGMFGTMAERSGCKWESILLWLAAFAVVATAEGQEPEPARAADEFVDTIGVNVHLGYRDTTYHNYGSIIRPRLVELGVRHIRDGVRADRGDLIAKLNDLASLGIRSILLVTPEEAARVARAAAPSVWAVEAGNEPDNKGEGWEERTRKQQVDLYRAIKGDPLTAHLPVVVSGMANTRDSPGKLGSLVEVLDYGNTHSYPGGQPPTKGGWGLDLKEALAEARKVCGRKPIVATESGYHNRLEERGHPGVSEAAEAKYLPRLLLIYFDAGVARTYLYEFADERPDQGFADREQHFGLIRADGTPKPAFVALRNLIALLEDPGPAFEPVSLAYSLGGDRRDIRRVLLGRRDGSFDLILWQEVPSFDTRTRRDIEVEAQLMTLRLRTPAARVECFRPIRSTEPLARFESSAEVPLEVPDDPLIVRITLMAPRG